MHGRVRGKDSDKDEAARAAMSEAIKRKAAMYTKLTSLVIKYRREGNKSPEALNLTANLLRINPDYYTLWNYRREILISMHGESLGLSIDIDIDISKDHSISNSSRSKIAEDIGSVVRDGEMKLSQEAIMKNPKSYGAWWHRVWIMQRFQCDYIAEIGLCTQFLMEDERNFHCWNYRRYVVEAGQQSGSTIRAEDEFRYSTEKIEQNFSNYSALHHRSVYITKLAAHGYEGMGIRMGVGGIDTDTAAEAVSASMNVEKKKAALRVEFAIVLNGVCVEPYDQSFWWYYRFLLTWMKTEIAHNMPLFPSSSSSSSSSAASSATTRGVSENTKLSEEQNQVQKKNRQWCISVLSGQIDDMSTLSAYHPTCKWPMDALVFLLSLRHELQQLLSIQDRDQREECMEKDNSVGGVVEEFGGLGFSNEGAGVGDAGVGGVGIGEGEDEREQKVWTYSDMGALLDRLQLLDPARVRRYDFLRPK